MTPRAGAAIWRRRTPRLHRSGGHGHSAGADTVHGSARYRLPDQRSPGTHAEKGGFVRQGVDVREPQEAPPWHLPGRAGAARCVLDTLDMVHGIREAQKRGGQSDRLLWSWARNTA
jgi:hypothetical protein